ncbi:hypothetical protein Bmyc01_16350 [Bacillus mycoides]|nr:hypothetical protein Bmyc01_16350 [Bacillus mycoides]
MDLVHHSLMKDWVIEKTCNYRLSTQKVGLGKNNFLKSKIHLFFSKVNNNSKNLLTNITIKVTLPLSFVTLIFFAYTVK